jgi:hypothetical protein
VHGDKNQGGCFDEAGLGRAFPEASQGKPRIPGGEERGRHEARPAPAGFGAGLAPVGVSTGLGKGSESFVPGATARARNFVWGREAKSPVERTSRHTDKRENPCPVLLRATWMPSASTFSKHSPT